MRLQKSSLTGFIILLLAIFSVVFHLIFSNNFEYHRDELLYFSLGTHPAAGYATTPPLIGWLGFVLIRVLGYSLFTVKLVPSLLSGGMVLLGAALAKELEELFSDIIEVGRISNPYAREFGTTVYLCRNPVCSFNAFYYEILVERGVLKDEG